MKPTLHVDHVVDNMAAHNVQRFTVASIVRQTELEPQLVFERLLELVDDTKLVLVLDAFCPQCDARVQRVEHRPVLPLDLECLRCGLSFQASAEEFVPSFRFDAEYQSLKKKTWAPVR
jgi:ribosomal protein S27AE